MPESQTSGPVVASLVVECGPACHVQITASPGDTVTVEGEKANAGPMSTA